MRARPRRRRGVLVLAVVAQQVVRAQTGPLPLAACSSCTCSRSAAVAGGPRHRRVARASRATRGVGATPDRGRRGRRRDRPRGRRAGGRRPTTAATATSAHHGPVAGTWRWTRSRRRTPSTASPTSDADVGRAPGADAAMSPRRSRPSADARRRATRTGSSSRATACRGMGILARLPLVEARTGAFPACILQRRPPAARRVDASSSSTSHPLPAAVSHIVGPIPSALDTRQRDDDAGGDPRRRRRARRPGARPRSSATSTRRRSSPGSGRRRRAADAHEVAGRDPGSRGGRRCSSRSGIGLLRIDHVLDRRLAPAGRASPMDCSTAPATTAAARTALGGRTATPTSVAVRRRRRSAPGARRR